jgi:hypothetical protein
LTTFNECLQHVLLLLLLLLVAPSMLQLLGTCQLAGRTCCVQHGLRCTLALGLGDAAAVLVETCGQQEMQSTTTQIICACCLMVPAG